MFKGVLYTYWTFKTHKQQLGRSLFCCYISLANILNEYWYLASPWDINRWLWNWRIAVSQLTVCFFFFFFFFIFFIIIWQNWVFYYRMKTTKYKWKSKSGKKILQSTRVRDICHFFLILIFDKCNFYMIFIILLFIKIVSFPLFLLIWFLFIFIYSLVLWRNEKISD